ncbi:MAG: class I SAM-dependent methyltransferase [Acidimicrobiales bacterium]
MGEDEGTRWGVEAAGRASSYDDRWLQLAAQGQNVHGEADFVEVLGPRSVLDAGCGTGRVGIELARRGLDVVGVDLDPSMLDQARSKAPSVTWVRADLAALDLGRRFDAVVLAGNVMIYLAAGTEDRVVAALARHLEPGGALVAGFQLEPNRLDLATYDSLATEAGLQFSERWATWDREPFIGDAYAVSVHRRAAP